MMEKDFYFLINDCTGTTVKIKNIKDIRLNEYKIKKKLIGIEYDDDMNYFSFEFELENGESAKMDFIQTTGTGINRELQYRIIHKHEDGTETADITLRNCFKPCFDFIKNIFAVNVGDFTMVDESEIAQDIINGKYSWEATINEYKRTENDFNYIITDTINNVCCHFNNIDCNRNIVLSDFMMNDDYSPDEVIHADSTGEYEVWYQIVDKDKLNKIAYIKTANKNIDYHNNTMTFESGELHVNPYSIQNIISHFDNCIPAVKRGVDEMEWVVYYF